MTSHAISAQRGAFLLGKPMFKRLILILALAGLIAPSYGAGIIPGISMTQQLDSLGKPLNGGKLYTIQAGTTSTPQNCYQDSGLTLAWPNPLTLDSAGRIPQVFCADGSIKIRLTNSAGVQQLVVDNILVVGPSGGSGGGGSVDPTTILQTGQLIAMYGTDNITGFVRCNGRTVGSASSGGTERANADTEALFEYLWGVDSNLTVSSGRGASAAADFAANKTITLPDCRGRVVAGLDDMGNSAASRLTSTYFGTTTTTLGAASTTTDHTTLVTGNLPPYTPSGTISNLNGGAFVNGLQLSGCCIGNGGSNSGAQAGAISISSTFTGTAQGGTSTPFANVQPTILMTYYFKL